MEATLVSGPGVVDAERLVAQLARSTRVLVHEEPRTLHASHLRDARIHNLVYLPGLTRWSGMRSEPHALRGLLDASEEAGVERVVVLSSHRVYGASAQHSLFLPESTAYAADPRDAELRDLIAIDRTALSWAAEGHRSTVVVLRPVYVLAGQLGCSLERYFGAPFVPQVLGFNPMLQLLHEHDLCRAIAMVLDSTSLSGAFHVVGSGSVPVSVVARERKVRRVPLVGAIGRKLNQLAFEAGRSGMSNDALPFLTHVLSVDGSALARAVGYEPIVPLRDVVLGRPYRASALELESSLVHLSRSEEVGHASIHV